MMGFLPTSFPRKRESSASDSEHIKHWLRKSYGALTRFWFPAFAGMTLLFMSAAHAAETPKIDPAACRALVNYHEPAGVEYQPGVDVDGHYVAPADVPSNASPALPKKINIPLTLSLAKVLNLNTNQPPYNQLGSSTEVPLGTITVEGNKATLNGKPLSDAQQDKLSDLCAKNNM